MEQANLGNHEFGGVSTDLKLALVEGYLRGFTQALKQQPWDLWYIDAFAGTGERTVQIAGDEGNLLEDASEARIERLRGSARIALEVEPPFQRLIFIEKNSRHCAALRALLAEFPHRNAEVIEADANDAICDLVQRTRWGGIRAVMFLDPYGMHVAWETLRAIRSTKAIDVWYLVCLAGLFRQAPISAADLSPDKRAAITRTVGTTDWEAELYQPPLVQDMFLDASLTTPAVATRQPGVDAIESYFYKRLRTLFPAVVGPRRLRNNRNVPMFSLFFVISNPSGAAIALATKMANHMLKAGRLSQ